MLRKDLADFKIYVVFYFCYLLLNYAERISWNFHEQLLLSIKFYKTFMMAAFKGLFLAYSPNFVKYS